ncbi:MAG: type II toxin-antitoxin system HicB family antitoxin [Aureliella sp.]
MSKSNYTAVVTRDGDWWIGWIEEIPGVNCQEMSREALLQGLSETLAEILEMNRSDALSAAGDSYEEIAISI